jgi:hypothetical protein
VWTPSLALLQAEREMPCHGNGARPSLVATSASSTG